MSGAVETRSCAGQGRDRDHDRHAERALRGEEKVRLGLLALPTLAFALAITTVSTYLAEIVRQFTQDTTVIGLIVGSEGIMALWVPLIAGAWSDKLHTPIGGRLPFVLAGALPAAAALTLIGFLHAVWVVALVAALFFGFYFVAYEPYRAMYPDLLDEQQVAGRAQSTQAVARGIGTGVALLGGGLLLSVGRPVPFIAAAGIVVVAVAAFVLLLLRHGVPDQMQHDAEGVAHLAGRLRRLIAGRPALRAYLVANALWEMALSALKAFVILYLTIGLGYGLATGSLLVGGVAVIILIGAGVAGPAGDRFGRERVVEIGLWAYGLGFLVLIFTTSRPLIVAAIPFLALGGGAVMTLAYALLMPRMPADEHGTLTGFYSLSRGLGIVAGPVLAGALISLMGGTFQATHGFQAMWIVCAGATFASLPFVRHMRRLDRGGSKRA